MLTCLDLVQLKAMPAVDGEASGDPTDTSTSGRLNMFAGETFVLLPKLTTW